MSKIGLILRWERTRNTILWSYCAISKKSLALHAMMEQLVHGSIEEMEHTIKHSLLMEEFDKLVFRSALIKRNDIIDRYGDEGYDKLLAKRKQTGKKEHPEVARMKYYSTIQALIDAWEASPWNNSKIIDKSKRGWVWDLSDNRGHRNGNPTPVEGWEAFPNNNSKKTKSIKNAWLWDLSGRKEGNVQSRRHSMDF